MIHNPPVVNDEIKRRKKYHGETNHHLSNVFLYLLAWTLIHLFKNLINFTFNYCNTNNAKSYKFITDYYTHVINLILIISVINVTISAFKRMKAQGNKVIILSIHSYVSISFIH